MNILDIAQNSVTAGAALIGITVDEQPAENRLTIIIEDNGCGMDEKQLEAVKDPFYTTRKTRRVGFGVPFFKMAAEMTGGSFAITSKKGEGTTVTAVFVLDSIDRMPLGDINATIESLISCNPGLDFVYRRRKAKADFSLDTREMRKVLGGLPLNSFEVTEWIREYLADGEKELSTCNN